MTAPAEPDGFTAVLTITVKEQPGGGLLASLISDGNMSDPFLDRRFYSMRELPPPDLPPYEFWGTVLSLIGGFLGDPD